MNIPFWHVLTWQRVELSVTQFSRTARAMRRLGLSIKGGDSAGGLCRGEVIWGGVVDGRMIGLAWEWGEALKGVVALADPLGIVSNVQLVTDDGAPLDGAARVLHLNGAVCSLKWQAEVPRRAAALLKSSAAALSSNQAASGLNYTSL